MSPNSTIRPNTLVLVLLMVSVRVDTLAQDSQARARNHLAEGAQFLQQGKLQPAEDRLRRALSLDASIPDAFNLLGVICDQTGRSEEAVRHFLKALELDPASATAHNNLGASYSRRGNVQLARDHYEKALAIRPDDLTANYSLGLIALQTRDPLRALPHLEKARLRAPADPGVLLNLARAYFGLERREEGLRAALELTQRRDTDGGTYFTVGALLLENQMFGDAAEQLSRASHLSPQTPEILLALAHAYDRLEQTGKAVSAVAAFLAAWRAHPENQPQTRPYLQAAARLLRTDRAMTLAPFQARYLLAEILYIEGSHKAALAMLQELAGENGKSSDYFNLLGMCHAELNQFPEAAQAVIRAIDLDSSRADLYFNLAGIYQKAGDNAGAIQILEKGLARAPQSSTMHFAMGLSLFNLGKYAAAIRSFEEVLKIEPDFERAFFFLGRTYDRSGNRSKAIPAYREAIRLRPSYDPARFELALALMKERETAEARREFEEVIRLRPDHAEAHYHFGKLLAAEGQTAQASMELERAIALQPDFDDAQYQLGRLYLRQGMKEKAEAMDNAVNERKQKRREKYEKTLSRNSGEDSRLEPEKRQD